MKRGLLDPSFRYTPSNKTDVAATFHLPHASKDLPRDPLADRLSFLVALLFGAVLAMVAAALVMRLAA